MWHENLRFPETVLWMHTHIQHTHTRTHIKKQQQQQENVISFNTGVWYVDLHCFFMINSAKTMQIDILQACIEKNDVFFLLLLLLLCVCVCVCCCCCCCCFIQCDTSLHIAINVISSFLKSKHASSSSLCRKHIISKKTKNFGNFLLKSEKKNVKNCISRSRCCNRIPISGPIFKFDPSGLSSDQCASN